MIHHLRSLNEEILQSGTRLKTGVLIMASLSRDYRKSSIRSRPSIILDPKFPRLAVDVI